jgi:RNA polymerase sigma factor (sigma-70 family)
MMELIQTEPQAGGLEVTAVSRLKHTELWEAVKAFGTATKLAEHLGVHAAVLGQWVNLQRCPALEPSERWTRERLDQLEVDLLQVTGKLMSELFPESLRRSGFLEGNKVAEKRHMLREESMQMYGLHSNQRQQDRLDVDPLDEKEQRDRISKVLKSLTSREKEVIELLFGLTGEAPKNLTDTGRALGLTIERIRQVQSKAIKKLQHESRAGYLVELLPDGKIYEGSAERIRDAREPEVETVF